MKKIPRNNTRAIFEGLARRLSKKCFDQMRNFTELCLKDFTKIFEGVKISRLINATTFVYNMENFVFKVNFDILFSFEDEDIGRFSNLH